MQFYLPYNNRLQLHVHVHLSKNHIAGIFYELETHGSAPKTNFYEAWIHCIFELTFLSRQWYMDITSLMIFGTVKSMKFCHLLERERQNNHDPLSVAVKEDNNIVGQNKTICYIFLWRFQSTITLYHSILHIQCKLGDSSGCIMIWFKQTSLSKMTVSYRRRSNYALWKK